MKKLLLLLLFTCGIATAQTQPEIHYNGNVYVAVGDTYTQELVGFTEQITLGLTDEILTYQGTVRRVNVEISHVSANREVTTLTQVSAGTYHLPGGGTYRITAEVSDFINNRDWYISIGSCGEYLGVVPSPFAN